MAQIPIHALPSVYLIRHAEKPAGDGPPHGVSVQGIPDGDSLTPRGWQRAGALVRRFAPLRDAPRSDGLTTPTHLFASLPGRNIGSSRSLETLTPLAAALRLTVDVRFRKDELAALADAVRGTPHEMLGLDGCFGGPPLVRRQP